MGVSVQKLYTIKPREEPSLETSLEQVRSQRSSERVKKTWRKFFYLDKCRTWQINWNCRNRNYNWGSLKDAWRYWWNEGSHSLYIMTFSSYFVGEGESWKLYSRKETYWDFNFLKMALWQRSLKVRVRGTSLVVWKLGHCPQSKGSEFDPWSGN